MTYKNDCDDYGKQMIEIVSQMEEKKKLREAAITKVSSIIQQKKQLDIKVAEVEDQRM